MSEACLLLTCGLPGAGKTTLATQLAADRGAVRLAQEILRLGLSVVLDFGLWARIERDEMRSVARRLGVGVELRYLDAPIDELWRRIDARNSQLPWDSHPIRRTDLDEWTRIFQTPDHAEMALFDTDPPWRRTQPDARQPPLHAITLTSTGDPTRTRLAKCSWPSAQERWAPSYEMSATMRRPMSASRYLACDGAQPSARRSPRSA